MARKTVERIAYLLSAETEPPGYAIAETLYYEHGDLAERLNEILMRHAGEPRKALAELTDEELTELGNVIESHSEN